MTKSVKIKKGDQVEVIAGKDRGRRGKVLRVDRKVGRVLVERLNMVKHHSKANPTKGEQGGIVEREATLAIGNVMVVSPDSGRLTRVGLKILEDGRKVRVAKVDGATLDQ